jgi:hypothetical protein
LQFASNAQGPLVINLSQGFSNFVLDSNPDLKKQISDLIQQIAGQGNKYIVCAAGDNSLLTEDVLFPANLDACIAVGSVNLSHKDIAISKQVEVLTPMVVFTSFDQNFGFKKDVGSSYATAVMSSIISCIVSSKGAALTRTGLLSELKNSSVSKDLFQFDELALFQYQVS